MAIEEKGFVLNTRTVSLLVGLAGLFGFLWQTVSYAKALEAADAATSYRVETIEKWIIEQSRGDDKMNSKIDAVLEKSIEQTIAIRALELQMKDKAQR